MRSPLLVFDINLPKYNDRLSIVKGHRSTLANKEREILSREQALIEKEQHLASLLSQKDQEIASLRHHVAQLQQSHQPSQQEIEISIKQAVIRREEELRVLICKREEEVALAMARREEEIMEAVRNREQQLSDAWARREAEIRSEVEENMEELRNRERQLSDAWARREAEIRSEVEESLKSIDERIQWVVKRENDTHLRRTSASQPTPKPLPCTKMPSLETPVNRPAYVDFIPSAMKGIVLTSTGESLATPSQAELVNLFNCSPKVGLNFAKIFDFESGDHNGIPAGKRRDDEEAADSPPPSPSSRKTKEKERKKEVDEPAESSSSTSDSFGLSTATTAQVSSAVPPTRIRRPSIRNSTRPTHNRAGTLPTSVSDPSFPTTSSSSAQPKPLPHPHLRPSKSNANLASSPLIRAAANTAKPAGPLFQAHQRAPPEYDFTDEENLPSPFLRKSGKNSQGGGIPRPSLASARKASEEARKALLRA